MSDERNSAQLSGGELAAILFSVLLAMMLILWWFLYPAITRAVVNWKWVESWPLQFIPYVPELRSRMVELVMPLRDATFLKLMLGVYPLSLFWTPIVIFFCVKWAISAKKHPVVRMKRNHSVYTLLEAHARNFSAIAPVMDRDLLLEDPPEWRSPLDPGERARELGLIVKERDHETEELRITLNKAKAHKVLIADLGKLHEMDPRKWKITEKVMFAILAEAALNGEEGKGAPAGWINSQELRDKLNYSARNKQHLPNYSLANPLFEKWVALVGQHKSLNILMKRHRYVSTLLYAIYMETMETATMSELNKGVLQSADFIWLKPQDRPTFFYLNTAGRKTPFVESCAVFAQYQAEVEAYKNGLILKNHYLDNALKAWEEDLESTGVIDDRTQIEQ